MSGFISDLLAGLPVPEDAEVASEHVTSMLKGLKEAMHRLNVELEFVQSLRIARDKIDEIERRLAGIEESTKALGK